MYDPAVARFHTLDPHAENYYDISPFAYVANNPLIFTDPTGMDIEYDKEASFWFRVKTTVQLAAGWVASGTMRNQLNTLMKSDNVHTIKEADGAAGGHVISAERDEHNQLEPDIVSPKMTFDLDGTITNDYTDQRKSVAEHDKWKEEHDKLTADRDGTGTGSNIYIGSGKAQRKALKGEGYNNKVLFGHELSHTVDIDKGRFNTNNMKPGVGSNAQQGYGTYTEHRAVRYQNAVARDLNRFRLFKKLRIRNEY